MIKEEQAIVDAARALRAAQNAQDDAAYAQARADLNAALEADAAGGCPFEVGDWVEYGSRGYRVQRVSGAYASLERDGGFYDQVLVADLLPIPPRPKPRDGYRPSGRIITGLPGVYNSDGVLAVRPDPFVEYGPCGPRRWEAVREAVREAVLAEK